jgi:glycosyltransferase involved in cell wall biosynthesis
VIAVLNALPLVQDRLDSWREGLPADVQLIVVDGGSTDGSREWLEGRKSASHQAPLTVIFKDDSSIAEAWNNAIAVAMGEWVLFMGADDRIPDGSRWPGLLERLGSRGASVDACLFPVEIVSPAGRRLDVVSPNLLAAGPFGSGIPRVPHQGVFHRRTMWTRFGAFDTTYAVAADYEFLVRSRAQDARFEVAQELSPVQMTFGGVSTRSPLRTLLEYRRVHRSRRIHTNPIEWGTRLAVAAAREALTTAGLRGAADAASDLVRVLRGRPKVWTVP